MTLRIYGNRRLKTLPGLDTRPTPARVREAVFQIWQDTVAGCRWLDLCAGSGAMGAEALCRGAAQVVGVEQAGRACGLIRQNWQQVAQPDQVWRVVRGDVRHRLKALQGEVFDHIYLDPPYAAGLYAPVLGAIAQYDLLAPTGELAVEHAAGDTLPAIAGLQPWRHKVYGGTAVTFYRVAPVPATDPSR